MENTLKMLQAILEAAIEDIVRKNDITPAELDNVTKALCAIEKIKQIESCETNDEYSGRSYKRGRDNAGRFTSRDGQKTDGGYSGHSIRDRMIDKLEQMIDSARSEHERQTIQEWISRLDAATR